MKIVFLGSGAFGLPTLEAFFREHALVGIITQPDKPAGRARALTPTPVAQWRAANAPRTPIFKPENVNAPDVVHAVRGLGADAWVVIAYGQKLGQPLLEGVFAVNLHASLLPRWRGAAPINHAMLAGDAETGNSVITIAPRMDAGDVLGQSRRPLDPALTAGELHDLLSADGPALVMRVLDDFSRGALRREPQDETRVTFAPKLTRADAWVDFAQSAAACRRRVHGLTPWPGVDAQIGGDRIRLLRVEPVEPLPEESGVNTDVRTAQPGLLIDPARGVVLCAPGTALRLLEVQPPGKRPMPWADFARGRAGALTSATILKGAAPC